MSERNKTDGVNETVKVPGTIGYRTRELAPLLKKWRKRNPEVPWSRLISRALRNQLTA